MPTNNPRDFRGGSGPIMPPTTPTPNPRGRGPTTTVPVNNPQVNPRDPRQANTAIGGRNAQFIPATPKPVIPPQPKPVTPVQQPPVQQPPVQQPPVVAPKAPQPVTPPPDANLQFKQGMDLTPGKNIVDPNKPVSELGQSYEDTIKRNLANPTANLSDFGNMSNEAVRQDLTNPGQNFTDFGNTYDETLRRQLATGNVPGVENMRQNAARSSGLDISRSDQAARDALIRSGMKPTDPGFAAALQDARAGALSRNLEREDLVNKNQIAGYQEALKASLGREESAANRRQVAKGEAAGIENLARGAEQTALGQAKGVEDTRYNRGQTAYNQGETARLENKTDQQALINTVTDPKAKATLQGVLNAGGDVRSAYNEMHGISQNGSTIGGAAPGTIKEQFRSATPGQQTVESLKDEQRALNPKQPGESQADYDNRITKLSKEIYDAKYRPVGEATKQAQASDVKARINTLQPGEKLTDDEFKTAREQGLIKQYSESTIPRGGKNVQKFLLDNPSGIVSMNGKQFKVIEGGSPTTKYTTFGNPRHTDVVVVEDEQGNTKYIWDGKIQDKGPKDVGGHYWDLPGMEGNNGTYTRKKT